MTVTTAAQTPAPASATSKKAASKKTAATKKAAPSKPKTHPPAGEMVNAALAALKDRKGSSLQAIKKYIASTYLVDPKKQSYFIKKYLKSAVEKKTIVQAKGTGASGRFKLATDGEKAKKVAKKPAAKKTTEKTAKKPVKATDAKKTAAKKPVAKKTTAGTSKPKNPSKAKKTGKAPTAAKPKTPKKTTAPKAKPAAKK